MRRNESNRLDHTKVFDAYRCTVWPDPLTKVGNITCHAESVETFSFGRINNNHHQIPALTDILTTGEGYTSFLTQL
jgi:hypothetical protein